MASDGTGSGGVTVAELLRALARQARLSGGVGVDALTYITADQAERATDEIDSLRAEIERLQPTHWRNHA